MHDKRFAISAFEVRKVLTDASTLVVYFFGQGDWIHTGYLVTGVFSIQYWIYFEEYSFVQFGVMFCFGL
jgi:hypothetical protein